MFRVKEGKREREKEREKVNFLAYEFAFLPADYGVVDFRWMSEKESLSTGI